MDRVKLLLPLFILLSCKSVLGCVCFESTIPQQLKSSDAVFSGTVISVRHGRVRFKVEQLWKGNVGNEVMFLNGGAIISTRKDGTKLVKVETDCDFDLEAGNSYLIFARRYSKRYFEVFVCSHSQKLVTARDALKELGNGWPPTIRSRYRHTAMRRRRAYN